MEDDLVDRCSILLFRQDEYGELLTCGMTLKHGVCTFAAVVVLLTTHETRGVLQFPSLVEHGIEDVVGDSHAALAQDAEVDRLLAQFVSLFFHQVEFGNQLVEFFHVGLSAVDALLHLHDLLFQLAVLAVCPVVGLQFLSLAFVVDAVDLEFHVFLHESQQGISHGFGQFVLCLPFQVFAHCFCFHDECIVHEVVGVGDGTCSRVGLDSTETLFQQCHFVLHALWRESCHRCSLAYGVEKCERLACCEQFVVLVLLAQVVEVLDVGVDGVDLLLLVLETLVHILLELVEVVVERVQSISERFNLVLHLFHGLTLFIECIVDLVAEVAQCLCVFLVNGSEVCPHFPCVVVNTRSQAFLDIFDVAVEVGSECIDVLIEFSSCVFYHPSCVLVSLVEDFLFSVSDFVLQLSAQAVDASFESIVDTIKCG